MSGRKRQYTPRYRRRVEVHFGAPGRPAQIGFSGNISLAGMMLRTPRAHPPGTVLTIELRFPSRSLTLSGEVRWAREGPIQWLASGRVGMGIKFIDPPAELAELIKGSGVLPRSADPPEG